MMFNGSKMDHCPHCGSAFEIVSVKFRLSRTAMLAACPNCSIVFAEDCQFHVDSSAFGQTGAQNLNHTPWLSRLLPGSFAKKFAKLR
jgi:hypothetical protein